MTDWSFASPRNSVEAMTRFVEGLPFASAVYDAHIRDNGEVVPHVLMADLRRLFVNLVEDGREEDLRLFLEGIETIAASPSESIRNVVDVSFIEDAVIGGDRESRALQRVRDLLGPATAAQLEATERFHGDA